MKRLSVCDSTNPTAPRAVGELAEVDHRIYFEYDPEFLKNPRWLSPFKLPPEPGLLEHRDRTFGPLFGLFDDSLPDGWGLLLMDRVFRKNSISPETISPLDRLAYMGSRTMGALTYHPETHIEDNHSDVVDLHNLAQDAHAVMEGTTEEILPVLRRAGGSPGGARPKVVVGVKEDHLISGTEILPEGFTDWMVKFPSKRDAMNEGRMEYAYSLMARKAGIAMPPTRLFITSQGDAFFGMERFDRTRDRRIHMQTFGNLIHSNYRIPGCDYEQLMKITRVLTKNKVDVISAFRVMVFNIFAHNRDDHVKNFSFLLSSDNEWSLAPAYDLTFSFGPGGEHSMTVSGEGRKPTRSHIHRIAEQSGLTKTNADEVIHEVEAAILSWNDVAKEAGLSTTISRRIESFITANP